MLRISSKSFRCASNCLELVIYNNNKCLQSVRFASAATSVKNASKRSTVLYGIFAGIGFGGGYAYYQMKDGPQKAVLNSLEGGNCTFLDSFPPNIEISRKIRCTGNDVGLQFVLFQYPTCPFCCKVRAFLDSHGLSYDVVEVNPVLRQQLKWTSYRKVPILLVKIEDGRYLQLNDSSMIISVLESYLMDRRNGVEKVAEFYPMTSFKDNDGKIKNEIFNRYFLMYQGVIPTGETKETIEEVRKWRRWADDVLVHTLSPNVYRTTDEALESFIWFSEVGEWDRLFPSWEKALIVNVGAYAMWLIGKRLKKRHNLKDDVRESLYDACKFWLKEISRKGGKFHGGNKPNLADLAVYGVLSSIEGCQAFTDLTKNTKILTWYSSIKESLNSHHKLS